jgi:hypothetical protein
MSKTDIIDRKRSTHFSACSKRRSRELERLVADLELADDSVVDALGAGAVEADVVRAPAGAELVAAGRELADEVGQTAVVRVASSLRAQVGDEIRGHALPVGIEVDRRGVEEREAGAVGGLLGREVRNSEISLAESVYANRSRPKACWGAPTSTPFAGPPTLAGSALSWWSCVLPSL